MKRIRVSLMPIYPCFLECLLIVQQIICLSLLKQNTIFDRHRPSEGLYCLFFSFFALFLTIVQSHHSNLIALGDKVACLRAPFIKVKASQVECFFFLFYWCHLFASFSFIYFFRFFFLASYLLFQDQTSACQHSMTLLWSCITRLGGCWLKNTCDQNF